MLAVDAKRELVDNRAMSVAGQARYPDSVLCRFLDGCLPQRAVVAEDWVTRAASAPWTPVYLPDAESRQRLGLAAEMRIGLDLGDAPAYVDLLSFLPPAEYSALLSAAGFSPEVSPVAATGTADPLLFDWRRVHEPVRCDDEQRAALAACLEAAGMRNVQSPFSGRPAQARRLAVTHMRSDVARWRSERAAGADDGGGDTDLDGLAHLWEGYLPHGRRRA